jgi:hypothetical protein
LLRREPGGQLPQKCQKSLLIFLHATSVPPRTQKRTDFFSHYCMAEKPVFGFYVRQWTTSSNW